MIDKELKQQYDTIAGTRFWREYVSRIEDLREAHLKLLRNGNISEQITRGKYWQDILKYAEQILALPDKLIEYGDNE